MTVANKFYLYLLAGICVAATATEGQKAVMKTCEGIGFLYEPGDYRSLAQELQRMIESPQLVKDRKAAALCAARDRWNWESQSRELITMVESHLCDRVRGRE